MADALSVELPATIHQQLLTMGIMGQQTTNRDMDLAFARQRDSSAHALQTLQAVAAVELLVSNDPMQVAGLNVGMRTPTTIDHPSAIVGGK